MSNEPRCLACGNTELSPSAGVAASSYGVHVSYKLDDGSWLGKPLQANFIARICGSCGFVMMFARPDQLAKLREHWHQLPKPK